MEGLIFQSSEFGTDEIYANMEEYIMQITRDNYSQYAQMVQQMFGKKASSNDPLGLIVIQDSIPAILDKCKS